MPEITRSIAFEELGLGSLLKRYQLHVPPNQREYSWSEDEVSQLLQDFASAINEEGPYFLGTIVTIPRGEGKLEVVDGQQRLATTTLLLTAIKEHLETRDEALLVESITGDFLSGIDRERKDRVPKLTLNVDDNELFTRIVNGEQTPEPTRKSHHRLLAARGEAIKHVERIVAPVGERQRAEQLNNWVNFIEHRALVVLLRVPDDADAYKMFETLNDRGLKTSQADLIKNLLFAKAGERVNEVQGRWSSMRGALESTSDNPDITITFLRHALILQKGYLREVDIYDKVQDIVKSKTAAATLADTLDNLATVYVATLSSAHERWNAYPSAARQTITVLNLLDIKPMRPLILAVAQMEDLKEATRTLRFLISLSVRLMIASNTRSSSVEKPLADASQSVFLGELTTTKELQDALRALTPTDPDFKAEFAKAKVSNAKLARYYLRSLEMQVKAEPEPAFVPNEDTVINLEHVLPRNPEDNWPQFSEDEVGQFGTRLGNLALLRASSNSDLKSWSFELKKPVYAESPFALTSQIADADEWTTKEIVDRQEGLADLAVKTWPLNP